MTCTVVSGVVFKQHPRLNCPGNDLQDGRPNILNLRSFSSMSLRTIMVDS
jgi:hypothetical protein